MSAGSANTAEASRSKLARFTSYLKSDPANLSLLAEAARAAFEARDIDATSAFLARYSAHAPLPHDLQSLLGLAMLHQRRVGEAAVVFEALLAEHPGDPALSFNLAWSLGLLGYFERGNALLTDDVLNASPSAVLLKVRSLHHLGRLDEALALGQSIVASRRTDATVMGTLAAVAMDAENIELARTYARMAEGNDEGQATMGMLELGAGDTEAALHFFDAALATNPQCARALLGKGLGLLSGGDARAALPLIEQGAQIFDHHLGSWVAAAWARFVIGDYAGARRQFERAKSIDDTFAEIHGGIAMLDLVAGDVEKAKIGCEVAFRLDRRCLSAALVLSQIVTLSGDPERARRIQETAMNAPIGQDGATLAQSMARLGVTSSAQRRNKSD